MSQPPCVAATPAPTTGNAEIDEALAALDSLADDEVDHHHDRLAGVQDVLTRVLENSRNAPANAVPAALRPGQQHG